MTAATDAHAVAYEHIKWAQAHDMKPAQVLASIGWHAPAATSWMLVERALAGAWLKLGKKS